MFKIRYKTIKVAVDISLTEKLNSGLDVIKSIRKYQSGSRKPAFAKSNL